MEWFKHLKGNKTLGYAHRVEYSTKLTLFKEK